MQKKEVIIKKVFYIIFLILFLNQETFSSYSSSRFFCIDLFSFSSSHINRGKKINYISDGDQRTGKEVTEGKLLRDIDSHLADFLQSLNQSFSQEKISVGRRFNIGEQSLKEIKKSIDFYNKFNDDASWGHIKYVYKLLGKILKNKVDEDFYSHYVVILKDKKPFSIVELDLIKSEPYFILQHMLGRIYAQKESMQLINFLKINLPGYFSQYLNPKNVTLPTFYFNLQNSQSISFLAPAETIKNILDQSPHVIFSPHAVWHNDGNRSPFFEEMPEHKKSNFHKPHHFPSRLTQLSSILSTLPVYVVKTSELHEIAHDEIGVNVLLGLIFGQNANTAFHEGMADLCARMADFRIKELAYHYGDIKNKLGAKNRQNNIYPSIEDVLNLKYSNERWEIVLMYRASSEIFRIIGEIYNPNIQINLPHGFDNLDSSLKEKSMNILNFYYFLIEKIIQPITNLPSVSITGSRSFSGIFI